MADDSPQTPRRNRRTRIDILRRILSIPRTIAVLVYFLFEDLFLGALKPLFRFLGRLSPFIALGRALKRLNPYVALCVFAVPFILIEPVKVFSLFWISIGHFVSGSVLLVISYVVSLLVVERLFQATRDQLLSISWFAWCYGHVMDLRQWAIDQLKSTEAWRLLRPIAKRIAAAVKSGLAWVRGRLLRA